MEAFWKYRTAYAPRVTTPYDRNERLASLRTALTLADPHTTNYTVARYEARSRGVDLDSLLRDLTTGQELSADEVAVANYALAYRSKERSETFHTKTAPVMRAAAHTARAEGLAPYRARPTLAPAREIYGAAQKRKTLLSRMIDGFAGLLRRVDVAYA